VIAFLTGGGGFIGTAVARQLRARGEAVRALVRDPGRASVLRDLGCELVAGDLADIARLSAAMAGADLAIHLAGVYRVGIADRERPAMYAANVTGTEHALDAAIAAGVPRIVDVSTINAFGDTGGRVVDETYVRPRPYRYVSYYDETKHLGHLAAEVRQRAGAPVIIVQPGGVYGPGDPSQLGGELRRAMTGRLPAITFGGLGMNLGFVDDVAAGILLAADRGAVGESYVLGGELVRMADAIRRAARAGGARPPRLTTPTWLLRAVAPLASGRFGPTPNLRELIAASDDVTYWATDAKARRELGYAPRGLDQGLADLAASLRG
jgi:nucleoside-diphosphate-sugar epimerase